MQYPGHVGGRMLLGQCLLEERDAAGIEHLRASVDLNPETTIPACRLIYKFLHDEGRFEEAEHYLNRARGRHQLEQDAAEERSNLSPHDRFEPHGLDATTIAGIISTLPNEKDIAEAYLVRKSVKLLQERPLYVLGLVIKAPWYKPEDDDAHAKLIARVRKMVQAPGDMYVIALEKNFKPALRRMRAVPGALVYKRGK